VTQSNTQRQQDQIDVQGSIWTRAFEEVQRARKEGTTPDPQVFEDLTKSAGGD
jgi:hypothetical protein